MYETFNITIHGAGHIKAGQPCEDYSISTEDALCRIFVAADGHGDSNCPRSSFGSETICRIASEELRSFAVSIEEENWTDRLFDSRWKEPLIRQLITSIFGKWTQTVLDDFNRNPLTDEERAGSRSYIARYDQGERIEHVYGTTMIAGLLTGRYLLLLQQGDGRCDVFYEDGHVDQPIPWDDRCFANVTTSLCDTDAIASCRYHVIDLAVYPISACMAGSDGVEDSFFSMDQMHSYYRELLIYASEHGVKGLLKHLNETLPEFSQKGSRDDTTICGFIDLEKVSSLIHVFVRANRETDLQSSLKLLNDRITSMESGKMEYLQRQMNNAEQIWLKARRSLSPDSLFPPMIPDPEYEEKQKKYENAEKAYNDYKKRYEDLTAERAGMLEQIRRLRAGLPEEAEEADPAQDETHVPADDTDAQTPAHAQAEDADLQTPAHAQAEDSGMAEKPAYPEEEEEDFSWN